MSTRYVRRTKITDLKTFLKRKIKGEAIAYWDHDRISGTNLTIPYNCVAFQKGYLTAEDRGNLELDCSEFRYYEKVLDSFESDESLFNKNKMKPTMTFGRGIPEKEVKNEFKILVSRFNEQQKKCSNECPIIKKLREIDKIAVESFEKVLIIDSGIPIEILDGGVYELGKNLKDGAATVHYFDTREQGVQFEIRDIFTSENLEVKRIQGLIAYRIVDPAKLIKNVPQWARASFNSLNQWIGGTRSKPVPSITGCVKCFTRNKPGAMYCKSCGTDLYLGGDLVVVQSGTIKRAVSNLTAEEIIRGGAHIDETLKTGLDAEMLRWGLELISITLSEIDRNSEDLKLYAEAIKAKKKTELSKISQEYKVQEIEADSELLRIERMRLIEEAQTRAAIDKIHLERKKDDAEMTMMLKKQDYDHGLAMKKTDAKIQKSKAKIMTSQKAIDQAKDLKAASRPVVGFGKTVAPSSTMDSLDDPKNIQIRELNQKIQAMEEAFNAGTIQQDKYEVVVKRLKNKLDRLINRL